jgi:RimJ/RimL family protein N-acetyltransferase
MSFVRRVTSEDLPRILELARQFHAESPYHRDFAMNEAKVVAMIERAMFDPAWYAAVVVDGEAIVGMALIFSTDMFYSDAREAGDLTFYIVPEYRNGFAALRLLTAVTEWAKMLEVARLHINPNTGINHEAAARLFERAGFARTAETWTLELRV